MSACCANPSTSPSPEVAPEEAGLWFRVGLAGLVSAQSMMFGMAVNLSPPEGTARVVLHSLLAGSAVVVFLLVGLPLVRESFAAARRGRIVVEQLFLAGIFGAFFASLHSSLTGHGSVYYEVVTILVAIYTFGHLLGQRRKAAALRAVEALQNEFSRCRKMDCAEVEAWVDADQVSAGDRVRVRAGEAVAVDGEIETGTGYVQEKSITGEPFPVVKRPGDLLLSGSYALDSAFVIRARGGEREIDPVIQGLQDLRDRPPRLQRQADSLVAWFLPLVLVLAAATFVFWTWYAGLIVGMFNALAVLVVACPCAMGLATPIGLWSAVNTLARSGLRIRNADLIEGLAQADTVIFDKTGTLSEGHPQVVDFVCDEAVMDRVRLKEWIAAAERGARHPLAEAFSGWEAGGVEPDQTRLLPGVGLEARFGERILRIGSEELFSNDGQETGAERLKALVNGNNASARPLHVLLDDQLVAVALVREQPREAAVSALRALVAAGVETRIMSGDRSKAGTRLAADLLSGAGYAQSNAGGVGELVEAGLSAKDKARRVRELQDQGRRVCFVGDGVNDALAMAEAAASVAIGSGAGLAREAADAESSGDELSLVPRALLISRHVIWSIRRNLGLAACYNMAGIALAMGGVLHPVVAALLMLGSSVTVTWLALRGAAAMEDEGVEEVLKQAPPAVRLGGYQLPEWAGRPALARWMEDARGRPLQVLFCLLIFLAILVQGPFVAYLGQFHLAGTLFSTAVAMAVAFGVVAGFRWAEPGSNLRMGISMLSLGNLAMLIGWWGDAGWEPIIREGACLCGCPDSSMGYGLLTTFNWMQGFMVAASVPAVAVAGCVDFRDGKLPVVAHWLAGVAGMILGMDLAAAALAPLEVVQPVAHFLLTFGAMAVGMCLGMMVACRVGDRIARSLAGKRKELEVP